MGAFRPKSANVEAFQWDGREETATQLVEWMTQHKTKAWYDDNILKVDRTTHTTGIFFHNRNGVAVLAPTCWLIRNSQDMFFWVSAAQFEQDYEKVEMKVTHE